MKKLLGFDCDICKLLANAEEFHSLLAKLHKKSYEINIIKNKHQRGFFYSSCERRGH